MIRCIFRWLAASAAVTFVLLAGGIGYFAYSRFFRYQPQVDRVFSTISEDERHLSPTARKVIVALEPESNRTYFVAVSLLAEVAPTRVRMGEWHARNALWVLLLPRRFDEEERLLMFAHFLRMEGGTGVGYGARRYFRKAPSQLNESEIMQLLVIGRSPAMYSPSRHPDRFRKRLEVLRSLYRESA